MSRERLKNEPSWIWIVFILVLHPILAISWQELGMPEFWAFALAPLVALSLVYGAFYALRHRKWKGDLHRSETWIRGANSVTSSQNFNAAEALIAPQKPFSGTPAQLLPASYCVEPPRFDAPRKGELFWDENGLRALNFSLSWERIERAKICFARDKHGVFAPTRVRFFDAENQLVFQTDFKMASEEKIAAFLRDLRSVLGVEILDSDSLE